MRQKTVSKYENAFQIDFTLDADSELMQTLY